MSTFHGNGRKPNVHVFIESGQMLIEYLVWDYCFLSKTDTIVYGGKLISLDIKSDLQVPNSFQQLSSLLVLVQNAFLCDRCALIALI